MPYDPIRWENNVTPLNASNLNHMDNAIKSAHDQLDSLGWIRRIKFSFNSETGCLSLNIPET